MTVQNNIDGLFTQGLGQIPLSALEDYLTKIEATPAERRACILAVSHRGAIPSLQGEARSSKEDIQRYREWAQHNAPELINELTIKAIQGLRDMHYAKYPEIVKLALHFHEQDGGDELLLPLLKHKKALAHPELFRQVAERISDDTLRQQSLENLK